MGSLVTVTGNAVSIYSSVGGARGICINSTFTDVSIFVTPCFVLMLIPVIVILRRVFAFIDIVILLFCLAVPKRKKSDACEELLPLFDDPGPHNVDALTTNQPLKGKSV